MEEVTLTEAETKYYNDLFLCCDVEKTGKIPMLKATEFFRSANITNEAVIEISSLAGIPATALHISRVQFYSCLKLIAAHQAALPLRQELIAATVQLALPRFSWRETTTYPGSDVVNGLTTLPPPPPTDRRNSLQRRIDIGRRNSELPMDTVNSDLLSTDSEVDQNESSGTGSCCENVTIGDERTAINISSREMHRRRDGGASPEAWSTNSDSPTPTNSVAERQWVKDTLWHGLLGDEHRQLLGTEEESSDRHSSDEEDNENELVTIYQITPEQREYYYKQFKAVQHDPNGLLSGHAARIFFEKSRIPVEELRHIWQLCDVSRDGALSLSEFTAAMHLVVLRRNNIPLPTILPACLHPNVLQHALGTQQEPPEADLLHLNDDDNTDKTILTKNLPGNKSIINSRMLSNDKNINLNQVSSISQNSGISRQNITPPNLPLAIKNQSTSNTPCNEKVTTPSIMPTEAGHVIALETLVKEQSQNIWAPDAQPTQWTKFNESPTTTMSSPGLKPVNFDIKRTAQEVGSNPQILHPVPLRVTPVGAVTGIMSGNEVSQYNSNNSEPISLRETSPKLSSNQQAQYFRDSVQSNDLRAIQRPQAKKLPGKNIGALPPPPQREPSIGSNNDLPNPTYSFNKKEPPPLPPPRPHRHTRSSSLDLNKFKMNTSGQQPEITAQASFDLQTSAGFADFTHFHDENQTKNVSESTAEQEQHSLPPAPDIPPHVALPLTRISIQTNQRVSAFEVYRKPNTPRNSQSPQLTQMTSFQHNYSQLPLKPSVPVTFNTGSTTAIIQSVSHQPFATTNVVLPSADIFDKRVTAISETLRHVSFKQNEQCMPDVLRRLREQNNLLLRLCNDLSDELLTVQTRKEEMRLKLESAAVNNVIGTSDPSYMQPMCTISSVSVPVSANVNGGSSISVGHTNV